MFAVVRLKGGIKTKKEVIDTLTILGLKTTNSVCILPENGMSLGMIRRVSNMVTWGEVSNEIVAELKKKGSGNIFRLNPPRKGLRSIKINYPKGDLGYRGDKINDLVKRML